MQVSLVLKYTLITPLLMFSLYFPGTLLANEVEKVIISEDSGANIEDYAAKDPLEKFNRVMFGLNQAIDKILIRPVSVTYKFIVPEFGRSRVHNFLKNLMEPVNFLNGLLQLNPEKATTSLARFMINTTWGLGGIHDIASEAGVKKFEEGFGNTLAHYGADTGPYLVLPIIGPSSGRDFFGLIVDGFTDPFNYTLETKLDYYRYGFTLVDKRSSLLKVTDHIEKTSLDPYATYRSLYFQKSETYEE